MKVRGVALAVAATIAISCSRTPSVGPKIDPALATLIPQDTVLIVGTRVEALQQTPSYKKYLADRKFPQIEEFAQKTGLDPQKDLWQLLFVSNGKTGVLLGRGRFANEMEPRLEKEGAKRFGYKGFNLIGDEHTAVVFISSSTAAVGPTEALKSFIDQRQTSHGAPAALAEMMKDILPDSQFWAAYAGGGANFGLPTEGNLANVTRLVQSIEKGSVYFDLRTGLSGVAHGICKTNQDAEQVQTALKGFVGLGRLNTPANEKEMLAAFDSIRVTQEGTDVKLYLDVPQNAVDKFVSFFMGRRK